MIAPREERAARAPRRSRAAEPAGLALIDALTLARVPAWPAARARELLAAPGWRERLAALLREDPLYRTAILIASRGLRTVVERAVRGEPPDEREAAKLLAYAVRMATRTTPFGLFASVGPAAFGGAERRACEPEDRVAHANLDHEWLVGAVDAVAERAVADGEDVVLASATALRREGPRFALLDERKVTRASPRRSTAASRSPRRRRSRTRSSARRAGARAKRWRASSPSGSRSSSTARAASCASWPRRAS